MDKVQQLEADKAALEQRVTHLAGDGVAQGVIITELEENRGELCRLRQAVEIHEATVKQVLIPFQPLQAPFTAWFRYFS